MADKGWPRMALIGGGIKNVGLGKFDAFLDYLVNENSGEASKSPASIYKAVAWAYRCVNLRAGRVSTVPYVICKRSAPEDDAKPVDYPAMTRDLLWRSEAAECLWAANYVLKAQNAARVVKGLQWLNPNTMTVDTGESGITGFTQKVGETKRHYTPEQIIYAAQFNPNDDLGPGVSPMHVAMEAAGLALNANIWASRFFSHGAIPAVVLSTDAAVPDDEVDRIRTSWEKITSGLKNAWRTVILRNGMKATVVGMPVKDLAMPELFQQVRSQIACAFEIPETMLTDAANFATSAEHRRSFWLETIVPHAQWHAEAFNRQLFWPQGLEMRLQPEQLEAVQKDEAEKAASMKAMIDAATSVYGAKLCDTEEARAVISKAFENMSLPALATGWKPPEPEIPEQLEQYAGRENPPKEEPDEERAEVVPQPKPAMRADLERWQRKCEKAGKARPFESENIPAGMKALIEARLQADTDSAFDFLKKLDPARLADEKRVRDALVAELAKQQSIIAKRIAELQEADWEEFAAAMRNAVDDKLVSVYTGHALREALAFGIDFDVAVINKAAWDWATRYSYDLVSGLTDTTRALAQSVVGKFTATPGMTIGELSDLLEPAFGELRAEMIAVTETTRAYSAATDTYKELLKDAGLEMRRVWNTSADEKVCEICGPLDGKDEREWTSPPPAHPRCRCWTTNEYVGRVKDGNG